MTVFSKEQINVIIKRSFRDVLYREAHLKSREGVKSTTQGHGIWCQSCGSKSRQGSCLQARAWLVPACCLLGMMEEVSICTSVILTTPWTEMVFKQGSPGYLRTIISRLCPSGWGILCFIEIGGFCYSACYLFSPWRGILFCLEQMISLEHTLAWIWFILCFLHNSNDPPVCFATFFCGLLQSAAILPSSSLNAAHTLPVKTGVLGLPHFLLRNSLSVLPLCKSILQIISHSLPCVQHEVCFPSSLYIYRLGFWVLVF